MALPDLKGPTGSNVAPRLPSLASDPRSTARHVLSDRSDLAKRMKELRPLTSILVIDDKKREAEWMVSALRGILGYELAIDHCQSLQAALGRIAAGRPDVIFLDDRLGRHTAQSSIPQLRAAAAEALIIVVSGLLDRRRQRDLVALGAADAIDKEDLNGLTICHALIRAYAARRGQ